MASALEVKFVQRKLLVTFPRFVDRFGPGGIGTVGPPGAPGAPGEPGSPGVQGPEGPEGPIGLTGPEGPQGAPGDDGAQGLQGIQGPEGLVGPAGPEGPQGVPGDDGAPGSAGADGAQGLQGIQGPAGPAGPDGLAGPQGVPGDDGAPGNAGADGAQGLQGIQGPAGPDGPIGPEGLVGPAGPAGGPVGPAGEPGADGAAGEQGIQGIQGPAGPEGPEGPAGPQGVPGADSVVEGPTGPEGPPGSPGEAGTTGIQGIQGVEGIPGPIGSGYVLIQFGSTTYNPADGVITYIGGKFQQSPRSLASQAAIVVPIAGTVVKWMVEAFCNVYASAETVNLSLRWNDTSDFSTLTDSWDVAYTTVVSGTISQAVAAGDTLAVKVVPPTWPGTNPTGVVLYGWILIKADGPAGEAGPAGPQGPAGIPGLGAPVAFKAQGDTSSPTQTMGPATWTFFTSAALNVEVFDTDGFYDLATGKFQPTVAGYYTITATAAVNNMAVGKTFQTMITKNGSTAAGSGRVWGIKTESYSAANPTISTALGVVYLNGTTDYCQLAGNQTDTVTLSTPAYDGWLSFAGVLLKAD